MAKLLKTDDISRYVLMFICLGLFFKKWITYVIKGFRHIGSLFIFFGGGVIGHYSEILAQESILFQEKKKAAKTEAQKKS